MGTQGASGCCFQPSLLFFRLFLSLVSSWWSVVGCWCSLPIVSVGVGYRLSSADCRLSIVVVGSLVVGCRVLNVCVSCHSVFPWSVPTSELIN